MSLNESFGDTVEYLNTNNLLFAIWSISQLVGFVLTSYGVIRQSFADIAVRVPYGSGPYGKGPFGGSLSAFQKLIIRFAVRIKLLPDVEKLSIYEQKKNAYYTIVGLFFLALSLFVDIAERFINNYCVELKLCG